MKPLLLTLLMMLSLNSIANDTITIMQYNLLYYGMNNNWCNESNNNVEQKNHYIRTILEATEPDILTVCEFADDEELINSFIDNNLNINGVSSWRSTPIINTAESDIVNAIFYDSDKLRMKNHRVAQSYIRDIDVFELYFNTEELTLGDTIELVCVVAHLKSSSGEQNENARKIMIENALEYIDIHHKNKNVLLMGDFNLYSSEEEAYQLMTNDILYPNSYFIDPMGEETHGIWHDNINFSHCHTQSTNKNTDDCRAGGGLDDRFDFIMMSEKISTGNDNVRYVRDSYQAVGQDAEHFNNSVNTENNGSGLAQNVLDALYNNSDHLPVTMRLSVNAKVGLNEIDEESFDLDISPNPADNHVTISGKNIRKINIYNTIGIPLFRSETTDDRYEIDLSDFEKGLYLIDIHHTNGEIISKKLIIK